MNIEQNIEEQKDNPCQGLHFFWAAGRNWLTDTPEEFFGSFHKTEEAYIEITL